MNLDKRDIVKSIQIVLWKSVLYLKNVLPNIQKAFLKNLIVIIHIHICIYFTHKYMHIYKCV